MARPGPCIPKRILYMDCFKYLVIIVDSYGTDEPDEPGKPVKPEEPQEEDCKDKEKPVKMTIDIDKFISFIHNNFYGRRVTPL